MKLSVRFRYACLVLSVLIPFNTQAINLSLRADTGVLKASGKAPRLLIKNKANKIYLAFSDYFLNSNDSADKVTVSLFVRALGGSPRLQYSLLTKANPHAPEVNEETISIDPNSQPAISDDPLLRKIPVTGIPDPTSVEFATQPSVNKFFQFDVTGAFIAWQGLAPELKTAYFGIMIEPLSGTQDHSYIEFDSKENQETSHSPQLEVTTEPRGLCCLSAPRGRAVLNQTIPNNFVVGQEFSFLASTPMPVYSSVSMLSSSFTSNFGFSETSNNPALRFELATCYQKASPPGTITVLGSSNTVGLAAGDALPKIYTVSVGVFDLPADNYNIGPCIRNALTSPPSFTIDAPGNVSGWISERD